MTFFFVLSGFILVVASEGKNPLNDYSGYFWRRFARIYPIYIVYLLLIWSFIGFSDNLGDKPLLAVMLFGFTDLTLTNAWFPQGFMGGLGRESSWSLSAEVFFYAFFPVMLLHARKMSDQGLTLTLRWSVVVAALAPVIGRYLPAQGAIPGFVYYSLPIFRIPEFSAGVFYAVWVLRDPARLPSGRKVIIYLAGLTVFLFLTARALPSAGFDIMLIPALLVLIAYFLRADKNWASRLLSTRPLVFLGEISFCIYLMQIFTINLYRLPGHGATWMGGGYGCLAMTIVLAAAGHLLIEKPARKWILAKIDTV